MLLTDCRTARFMDEARRSAAVHELAITQSVVEGVSERFGEAKVHRVILQVGALSGIGPDAVRFCFEACARGTTLEGAVLEIDETPGVARCRDCSSQVAMGAIYDLCSCGSANLEWLAGRELRVRAVEVD